MGTDDTTDTTDTADHRPDIYHEGDVMVFRASSFGGCEQSLVRNALGHDPSPPPAWMLEKYQESAGMEGEVLRALEEQWGWRAMRPAEIPQYEVDDSGQFTLELAVPGGVIRCHPDAIAKCYRLDGVHAGKKLPWALGDQRVVEVKALSVKSSPFDLSKYTNYLWQFSIEMLVTKRAGAFVVAWKDDGKLVTREDGRVRLDVGWYDKPPVSLLEVKKRAKRLKELLEAAEAGEGLPPCDVKMFPCGFWAEHDTEAGVWAKPELEEIDAENVVELAHEVTEFGFIAKQAKENHDAAKKKLHDALVELGKDAGEYRAGKYRVTRVVKKGRTTYDTAAMKADGVEVEKYAKVGRGSDYVTVEEMNDGE